MFHGGLRWLLWGLGDEAGCLPIIVQQGTAFDLSVYYLFLQYFDTVGWVF